jgi:hypothetical protein
MSELREKVADVFAGVLSEIETGGDWALMDRAYELADEILAIPEIREGLYLYSRKKVKAGKPSREPALGHSIGTRR